MDELLKLATEKVGLIGVFVIILTAGAKGIWVWGWHYQEKCREADFYREMALFGRDVTKRAFRLVEDERRD